MLKSWKFLALVGSVAAGVLLLPATPARTADHRDGPTVQEDPAADPLDVFVFRNPNNGNTVLALTVAPLLVAGPPQIPFSPTCLYQFKIDNTGDNVEDLVIQATFSKVPAIPFGAAGVPAPAQTVRVVGPGRPTLKGVTNKLLDARRTRTFTGPANGSIIDGVEGMRAFAGQRDDPFFVDLIFALGVVNGRLIGRAPGLDTIGGFNCLALIVEVPPDLLRGPTGDVIKVWGTTSRAAQRGEAVPGKTLPLSDADYFTGPVPKGNFVQFDATGLPVINTVFIPAPLKEAFNRTTPADMRGRYRTPAVARVTQILENISGLLAGGATPAGQAAAATDIVLPDVATFNVTSDAGFLNGRRPQDDVVTTLLQVLTNNPGVTDGVEANDKAFLGDFPFLATPHAAAAAVPGRN